jgi:hypothetical protein
LPILPLFYLSPCPLRGGILPILPLCRERVLPILPLCRERVLPILPLAQVVEDAEQAEGVGSAGDGYDEWGAR